MQTLLQPPAEVPFESPLPHIQRMAPEFVGVRRQIHEHPEIAFDEHRTSDLVALLLQNWGYEVTRGLAQTGVVGRLRAGAGTRCIGLRADMDALPIQELGERSYRSRRVGLMHACGHDGHTATLLCAARALAERRDFDGTVHLIFQPAEETGGGAARMIAEGLFEHFPCDAVFALHTAPGLPAGALAFRSGALLASQDVATVTVRGVGGHGAMAHKATDAVVAAAAIVMALQTVVARNCDPVATAVVTVGAIHGGTVANVVPAEVTLELSIRAGDSGTRELLRRRIGELVAAQASSFGAEAEIRYHVGYPVLTNHAAETALARAVAVELFGEAQVLESSTYAGSEDFAHMLEHTPGCYLLLGNGDGSQPGENGCMVHHPAFDFNDETLPIGAAYWVHLVRRFLAAPPSGRAG